MHTLRHALLTLAAAGTLGAAAHALGDSGPCADSGSCHLSRWIPAGLSGGDQLGACSAFDGDTALIGAPFGDAVHVWTRQNGHWHEQAP